MRKYIIFFCLNLSSTFANSQSLAGYIIDDYLVSAIHTNGCDPNYLIGPPDDSTWVNFDHGDVISGDFGLARTDNVGDDLLLETSFHRDNYNVRLSLSTGGYSGVHNVEIADWIQITDVGWKYIAEICSVGNISTADRYILPLDFSANFGLTALDTVTGIEITFLESTGGADLAGIYIIAPCNTFGLNSDTALCQGETLTLNATTSNAYWVQVSSDCGIIIDTINVSYNPFPSIDLGNDTTICPGEVLTINATTSNATYLWQDNSTNPAFNVSQQGTYWVDVSVNNCISTATIVINYNSNLDLGNDTTICQGESLLLDVTNPNSNYLWQDSSTNSSLTVTQQGTYWAEVSTNNCSTSDTVNVTVNTISIIIQENGNLLTCPGSFVSYQWYLNDTIIIGATNSTYLTSISGNYVVEVIEGNGCSGISYILEFTFQTGLNERNESIPFRIFPNPTNGTIYLECLINEPYEVKVLNNLSQVVYEERSLNGKRLAIRLQRSGIYYLRILVDGDMYVQKVVKE